MRGVTYQMTQIPDPNRSAGTRIFLTQRKTQNCQSDDAVICNWKMAVSMFEMKFLPVWRKTRFAVGDAGIRLGDCRFSLRDFTGGIFGGPPLAVTVPADDANEARSAAVRECLFLWWIFSRPTG